MDPITPAAPVTPAAPDATQQRIDALTAQMSQLQESMQQQATMNQQLMETNSRLAEAATRGNQPAAPALPPLPEGTDPDLVRAIAAHVQTPLMAELASLKQVLSQQVGNLAGNQEMMAIQSAISGETPAVQADAMKLYKEAKSQNLQGWTPQNLVWMARGRVGQTAPAIRPPAPMEPGGPGGVPDVAPRPALPPAKTDAELKLMTPAARDAYWEARVGDSEITY